MATTTPKIGRPSIRSARLELALLTRLARGESLNSICKRKRFPSYPTVCKWLMDDAEFLNKYCAAREAQADKMVDEILDIADDGTNDWMERETRNGTITVLDQEHVQRSKLRVEARLRVAEKLLPKKYGAKPSDFHLTQNVNNFLIVTEAERLDMIEQRKRLQNGE